MKESILRPDQVVMKRVDIKECPKEGYFGWLTDDQKFEEFYLYKDVLFGPICRDELTDEECIYLQNACIACRDSSAGNTLPKANFEEEIKKDKPQLNSFHIVKFLDDNAEKIKQMNPPYRKDT
jgi:hypothetical protein